MLGIHPEIVHDLEVVHEIGELSWDGEVTEAHHLLGGVDNHRSVNAGPFIFRNLLQGG